MVIAGAEFARPRLELDKYENKSVTLVPFPAFLLCGKILVDLVVV